MCVYVRQRACIDNAEEKCVFVGKQVALSEGTEPGDQRAAAAPPHASQGTFSTVCLRAPSPSHAHKMNVGHALPSEENLNVQQ